MKAGKSRREIIDDDGLAGTAIRHHAALDKLEKTYSVKNRTWPVYTTVYYGPPGTGKSRRACHEAGVDAYYVAPPEGGKLWFDGYEGQENVVIDEFDGHFCKKTWLNRLLDRYPMRVPVKGSTVPFLAKKIWITTNKEPVSWYKDGLGPLHRRLSGSLGCMVHMPGFDASGNPLVWSPEGYHSPGEDMVGLGSWSDWEDGPGESVLEFQRMAPAGDEDDDIEDKLE